MDSDSEQSRQIEESSLEDLINCVKNRKVLYDSTSNSNKNKIGKEAAWLEIANETQKTALWCQVEWGKLRCTYYRKKKAIKGKSGQARLKIEAWPYFFAMQFLDDFISQSSTSGNMNMDGEFSLTSQNQPMDSQMAESNTLIGMEGSSQVTPEIPNSNSEPKTAAEIPKGRKRPADKVDEAIIKFLKKPEESADSHHHFCVGLADQLRSMTKKQSSLAKMKITEVMFQVEFEMDIE